MNKKLLLFFPLLVLIASCHRSCEELEPQLNYCIQDKYLKTLPSPFPALTEEEKQTDWAKEYQIGVAFAHQIDLYQAMTAFKRADILIGTSNPERKKQIHYDIILSYYLGKKYQDVIYSYENSDLRSADSRFPALRDLLIILYDSYNQLGEEEKAARILAVLQQYYPEAGQTLLLSSTLSAGDIKQVECLAAATPSAPYLTDFLSNYQAEKKSIGTAKALNAVLPGAGYLYLGQKQSALTAFLLNGLFITASYCFFHQGNIAAGAIFTSFETGWYFGGIIGAGQEAKYYNERLYERYATPMMNDNKIFPVLSLQYAF